MDAAVSAAPERVDRAHQIELQPGVLRVRNDGKRIYAEGFKAELVRQCLIAGTSVAATAMDHRINANLLRRWIGLQGARSACAQSPVTLLPVSVRAQFTAPPSVRVTLGADRMRQRFPSSSRSTSMVRMFACRPALMPSA